MLIYATCSSKQGYLSASILASVITSQILNSDNWSIVFVWVGVLNQMTHIPKNRSIVWLRTFIETCFWIKEQQLSPNTKWMKKKICLPKIADAKIKEVCLQTYAEWHLSVCPLIWGTMMRICQIYSLKAKTLCQLCILSVRYLKNILFTIVTFENIVQ